MRALRRAPIIGRHLLASLVVLVVLVGLLALFAGSLTRSTSTEAQAQQLNAEIAALERRVLEGEDELAFVESEAYLRWAARLHGYGLPGEEPWLQPAEIAMAAAAMPDPADQSLGAMVARFEAGLARRREVRLAPQTASAPANEDESEAIDFALEAALGTLQRLNRQAVG